MPAKRRPSRVIRVGDLTIGGDAPIRVQSMTSTDTRDVAATLRQIEELERAGCELVRLAVPDREAALCLGAIKARTRVPLVADIHFDYRLALAAIDEGVDGLRLNPGNIGGRERVAQVARAASERGLCLRVGVNAGSLEKELLALYGGPTAEAMAISALNQIHLLEEQGFSNIKVSLKAAEVPLMVEAYRLLASQVNYPLHLGVTEAGTLLGGSIKSAVGLGILLNEGLGDTIRVSLTGDPVQEVRVAYAILGALGLRRRGIELISCPTCGRCEIDLIPVAEEVERRLQDVTEPLKVAVMGCVVNGPGEARQADVGLAGGRGFGLIFRHGQVVKKVAQEEMVAALLNEVAAVLGERR